jgi:GxxExxY protein
VYHQCMMEELTYRKINFLSEMKVPLVFRDKTLNINFRCDLLIEESIVVELKSYLKFLPHAKPNY